jgi:hypothetical protein
MFLFEDWSQKLCAFGFLVLKSPDIIHIRLLIHARKYGAMVQKWTVMQKIVGSSLLGILSISAPKRQLMCCQM